MAELKIRKLNENATLPTHAHTRDSGWDLYASEYVVIEPGATVVIPTGIAVQLPQGTEATVRPRSGVTSKTKLRVQLGTIDNGYNGEIGIIVDNISPVDSGYAKPYYYGIDGEVAFTDSEPVDLFTYIIRKGDRIAQLVVQHLPQVMAIEVTAFSEAFDGGGGEGTRGDAGFGSSGVRGSE